MYIKIGMRVIVRPAGNSPASSSRQRKKVLARNFPAERVDVMRKESCKGWESASARVFAQRVMGVLSNALWLFCLTRCAILRMARTERI